MRRYRGREIVGAEVVNGRNQNIRRILEQVIKMGGRQNYRG